MFTSQAVESKDAPSPARCPPRSAAKKLDDILTYIRKDVDWTLDAFLHKLFQPAQSNTTHHAMLKAFLSGQGKYNAATIVNLMYGHDLSVNSDRSHPSHGDYFSDTKQPEEIKYSQASLSTWALQLVIDTMDDEADYLCSRKAGLWVRAGGIKAKKARWEQWTQPALDVTPMEVDDGASHSSQQRPGSGAGARSGNVTSQQAVEVAPNPTYEEHLAMRVNEIIARHEDPAWEAKKLCLTEKYKRHAPVTWQLLSNVLRSEATPETPSPPEDVDDAPDAAHYRPKEVICTSVISKLIFGRNSWTNLFAMCRGISLFATKAHQSMYRVRSRLAQCVPYSTVHTTLVTMAVAERKVVQELFATPDADPPLVVFDNMQAMARRREQKLGTANKMIIGTGATAVKMENCEPGAFDLAPILEKYEQGGCRELRIQDVLDKIDIERMQKVFAYHWLDALVTYVPDLAVYRTEVSKLFARNIRKHQINPKQHTTVYPLSTNSANEVSTRGLKDALTDFLKQLGITKTTLGKRLIFFHGDGKSYEGMLKVKKYLSASFDSFSSLRFIRPVLELWHTK
ncbi:hypothetical protein BV25DRAFT_1922169 [Artomyces pyxidatus]|uniref:Uncharacterized protein n=1 Tax=Artomyces pyxidatus TaxID=48021 RepID=A0ACB8SGV8_9AGAM|nr:hypothetical protein BV25DRAFT_1922169 [Artomyces pyxidatus]